MPRAVLVFRKNKTQYELHLKCGHRISVVHQRGEQPRSGQVWCCPRCTPVETSKSSSRIVTAGMPSSHVGYVTAKDLGIELHGFVRAS